MTTTTTSYSVMVTPERASMWLAARPFARQRPLSRARVTTLEADIRRGAFSPSIIEFALLDDCRYLINGQHRLHAIVAADMAVEMVVVEHRVRDEADMNARYGRIDRGKTRTLPEVYAAYGLQETLGLSQRQVTLLGSAVTLIATNFSKLGSNSNVKSADARVALASAWAPNAQAFFAALEGGFETADTRLRLAGVVAVGIVTMRFRPEKAEEFWSTVALNDGLRRGTPEHTLVTWLSVSENRRFRENHVARAVSRAWNAWYRGRPLTMIRQFAVADPIEIAGTPFDGKQTQLPVGVPDPDALETIAV